MKKNQNYDQECPKWCNKRAKSTCNVNRWMACGLLDIKRLRQHGDKPLFHVYSYTTFRLIPIKSIRPHKKRNNNLTLRSRLYTLYRRTCAYHLTVPVMVVTRLLRRYRRLSSRVRGWFVMRGYWRRRLASFEQKALFIHRMQYFGSYRCYREYMDLRRYHK